MSSGKRRNPLGLSLPPTVNENSESGDGVAVRFLAFHFIFYKSSFSFKIFNMKWQLYQDFCFTLQKNL